jgi:hypothetical protein
MVKFDVLSAKKSMHRGGISWLTLGTNQMSGVLPSIMAQGSKKLPKSDNMIKYLIQELLISVQGMTLS